MKKYAVHIVEIVLINLFTFCTFMSGWDLYDSPDFHSFVSRLGLFVLFGYCLFLIKVKK